MVTDLYYLAAISFFCQIHQYFVKIHWCGTNDYSGMLIDFQEEALYEKIFNCCMMLCITKHYLGVYRPRCHLDKRIEMWKSFISTKSWKNCPESYRLQMSCICTWALLFIWQYMYQCLMFKLFSSKYLCISIDVANLDLHGTYSSELFLKSFLFIVCEELLFCIVLLYLSLPSVYLVRREVC